MLNERVFDVMTETAQELGRLKAKIHYVKVVLDTKISNKAKLRFIEREFKESEDAR